MDAPLRHKLAVHVVSKAEGGAGTIPDNAYDSNEYANDKKEVL